MLRTKTIHNIFGIVLFTAILLPVTTSADTIGLNSSDWLGNMNLDKKQLADIKKQVVKSLNSPIDTELECGEVRGDCVVRSAREWRYQGNRYREVVIFLHTKGHASKTINQSKGKWPTITTESEQKIKKSADKKTRLQIGREWEKWMQPGLLEMV